jgi:hypothetical protein
VVFLVLGVKHVSFFLLFFKVGGCIRGSSSRDSRIKSDNALTSSIAFAKKNSWFSITQIGIFIRPFFSPSRLDTKFVSEGALLVCVLVVWCVDAVRACVVFVGVVCVCGCVGAGVHMRVCIAARVRALACISVHSLACACLRLHSLACAHVCVSSCECICECICVCVGVATRACV